MPGREVVDGALIIFGGALLLTPGFITDILGFLLLLPPTRAIAAAGALRGSADRRPAAPGLLRLRPLRRRTRRRRAAPAQAPPPGPAAARAGGPPRAARPAATTTSRATPARSAMPTERAAAGRERCRQGRSDRCLSGCSRSPTPSGGGYCAVALERRARRRRPRGDRRADPVALDDASRRAARARCGSRARPARSVLGAGRAGRRRSRSRSAPKPAIELQSVGASGSFAAGRPSPASRATASAGRCAARRARVAVRTLWALGERALLAMFVAPRCRATGDHGSETVGAVQHRRRRQRRSPTRSRCCRPSTTPAGRHTRATLELWGG